MSLFKDIIWVSGIIISLASSVFLAVSILGLVKTGRCSKSTLFVGLTGTVFGIMAIVR